MRARFEGLFGQSRAIRASGFPLPVVLLCALLLISPGRPLAEIILSVPDYTWADLGTEFMLPVRTTQILPADAVTQFAVAVYLPVDVLETNAIPVPGEVPLLTLVSSYRDSAYRRIVNIKGTGGLITGEGVLFYLRCKARPANPDTAFRNTTRPLKLFRASINGVYQEVLNSGEVACQLTSGNLLIRNPDKPIVWTTGKEECVDVGNEFVVPVRTSAIWPWDSVTTYTIGVTIPIDVITEEVTVHDGELGISRFSWSRQGERVIVSGSNTYITGQGTLFYLRCRAKGIMPDTTIRNSLRWVRLDSVAKGVPPLIRSDNTPVPWKAEDGSVVIRDRTKPYLLSTSIDTVVTVGTQLRLPVRISRMVREDSITSFNFGIRTPRSVMRVDSVARGPAVPDGAFFSSAQRDSLVVVGGAWTLPSAGEGALFFLYCTVKWDVADNSVWEVAIERLDQGQQLLSFLNEREKPPCVSRNGSVRINNPTPPTITLSLTPVLLISVGQLALLPVHVDRLTAGDSVTTVNMRIRMPSEAMSGGAAAFAGELLPDGTVLETQTVQGGVVVSCVAPYPISGSGEIFTLHLTPAPDCPDSLSGPVLIEKVIKDGIALDYLVKAKRPVNIQNGTVLVRNFNLVPVALAASSDTAAVAGSPLAIAVEADGLISSTGTTAFQFSLSIPPALFPSPTFEGGLLSTESITRVDSAAGLFRVSGSVANPAGGSGNLFKIQGTLSTDIADGALFEVAIERLTETGVPLPIAEKNGQHPDCSVSNGVIRVRNSVSVAEAGVLLPAPAEIRAYPNPFNAVITFRVHGPLSDGPIDATLYTVLGTVVRRWSQSTPEWTWDGRDASGVPSASGVYVVVVRNGEKTWQKRVTLLR